MTRVQARIFLSWRVALCFLLLPAVPAAAQAGQRLILKDGSFQQILKYEISGDHTRYYSTLRHDWEEVPSDLVDWKATREWNAQPMQLPAEEKQEPGGEVDKLTVAPGLQLPSAGGVFILDTFSGHPSLVELNQVPGVLTHDRGGIFHSGISPKATARLRLELKGLHARTQVHILLPALYLKLAGSDEAQPIAPADRFRLVRLETKKRSRTLADVAVSIRGKQSETEQFVPVRIESFHQGWWRVVPATELEPGEYALVEMLDRNRFNSYAWDFGVDPAAPGNINSITAYSVPSDEGSTFSPELKTRPK